MTRERIARSAPALVITLALTTSATAQSTSWKDAIGGSFGDPRRWTNGVPAPGASAAFGLNAGPSPFVVTLDQPRSLGLLSVTNQSPTIDLQGLRGPSGAALFAFGIATGSDRATSSLSFENGTLGVAADTVVGTPTAGSTLRFVSVDARLASLNVVHGDFVATSSTIDHGSWAAPFALRVGLDANTTASATLDDGTVAQLTRIVAGANGGTGAITISDGAVAITMLDSFIGGNFYDDALEAGTGSITLDGGTLQKAPSSSSIQLFVGSEGNGTITLRGGALVNDVALVLGQYGGTAALICDGPATVDKGISQRADSTATMVVTGPTTTLQTTSILAQEGESDLDLSVLEGAHLSCSTQIFGSLGHMAIHVRDGATISAPSLSLGMFADVLEISGPNSACTISGTIPAAGGAVTYHVDHGGQLSAGSVTMAKQSTLRLGLSNESIVPVVATGSATILGFLDVQLDRDVLPQSGQSFVLAQGNPLAVSWRAISVPTVPGLLPITDVSATTLTLTFTDDVSQLAVSGPSSFQPGFLIALHTTAVVDGIARDVSQFATWSSSDPSVALVEQPGFVRSLANGTTTITVVAGPATARFELTVDDDAAPPPFSLASAGIDGPTNGDSSPELGTFTRTGRTLSADGNLVAFDSSASNLILRDDEHFDVFVRSIDEAATQLVSIGEDGDSPGDSALACISGDGRFVEFGSFSHLTSDPPVGGFLNVYVRDRLLGTTELASIALSGTNATGTSQPIGISDDGRFAAFTSWSPNLVPGDVFNGDDVFVRDLWTEATILASADASGALIPGGTIGLDMTPDGKAVLLRTTILEIGDSQHNSPHVRLKRLDTGELIDVTQVLGGPFEVGGAVSADGRYVAFTAWGLGIDGPAPPAGTLQVFVRDLETNELVAVTRLADGTWSNGSARAISMSANGRYVCFESTATNLLPDNPLGATPQVWRLDRITGALDLVSESPAGPLEGTTGHWTSVSANGRAVALATDDPNFVAFDTNGAFDVIVRRFGSGVSGDVDGDGVVNAVDLALLIGAWGSTDADADLDGDGDVDASDLALLLGGWTD